MRLAAGISLLVMLFLAACGPTTAPTPTTLLEMEASSTPTVLPRPTETLELLDSTVEAKVSATIEAMVALTPRPGYSLDTEEFQAYSEKLTELGVPIVIEGYACIWHNAMGYPASAYALRNSVPMLDKAAGIEPEQWPPNIVFTGAEQAAGSRSEAISRQLNESVERQNANNQLRREVYSTGHAMLEMPPEVRQDYCENLGR